MKKFAIISTYPEKGSQNIGDYLITSSLISALEDVSSGAEYDVIWRAESWRDIGGRILNSDHVIFACLAIRPEIHIHVYPYLNEIVNGPIPFSIVAAGTDLPVLLDANLLGQFGDETLKILNLVSDRALLFTTRGHLTQEFCLLAGMKKAKFCGDIAFYDKRFDERVFKGDQSIN